MRRRAYAHLMRHPVPARSDPGLRCPVGAGKRLRRPADEWLSARRPDLGAHARSRVARALVTRPRLAKALLSRRASYAKVRALTRVATPDTSERWLTSAARHGRACGAHRPGWRCMDRKEGEGRGPPQHESRALHVYPRTPAHDDPRRLSPRPARLVKALRRKPRHVFATAGQRARRAATDPSADHPDGSATGGRDELLAEPVLPTGSPGLAAEHYQVG